MGAQLRREASVMRLFEGGGYENGAPTQTFSGFFHHLRESSTSRGTVISLERPYLFGIYIVLSLG